MDDVATTYWIVLLFGFFAIIVVALMLSVFGANLLLIRLITSASKENKKISPLLRNILIVTIFYVMSSIYILVNFGSYFGQVFGMKVLPVLSLLVLLLLELFEFFKDFWKRKAG